MYINDLKSIISDAMYPVMTIDSSIDTSALLSYELRKLAHKLGITIIAISDIVSESNETDSDIYARNKNWPSLDDFDCEGLVNSANVVLLIHRPEFYKDCCFYYGPNICNIMFVNAAKNVSGPTGTIALHFDHESLVITQPHMTEEEFHELERDTMIPLPNAGNDPPMTLYRNTKDRRKKK